MTAYADFHRRSIEDRDAFWAEQAQLIDWQTPPQQICDYANPPFAKWFVGGTTNLCHNAVDRHLKDRADQAALIFVSTETEQEITYTYRELHAEVCRMANALKELGAKKGDRITIYLPMIPEAAYAMLACSRIGAVHSVVFGGFSPDSLAGRILDCDSKVVITADEGVRGGKIVPLKMNVDLALTQCPDVRKVLVVERTGPDLDAGRHDGVAARGVEQAELVVGERRRLLDRGERPDQVGAGGERGAGDRKVLDGSLGLCAVEGV